MRCPHCSTAIPEAARFCPGCGASQSSVSQMPTAAAGPAQPGAPGPLSAAIGRLDSSASSVAAFTPGQVLSGRYRIIGLLGRGGMGEVYRADDLTLGQPVSLKFLPHRMAETPGLLERFHAEVRNARHVSHPNVCRVYDIGEVDGQQFLTMEFVDGEDLATLLRRIGHLPRLKAQEVARQLCAGLAAAHDKGVLHRDLKPSNVMIDGQGRVRITDFGLAVRADQARGGDLSGTPAYMAPEQFEGKAFTVQSDLYSLGLVLYEVYTGHRPYEATTLGEWKSRHTQSEPTLPSQHGEPIDEVTERAIMRCLDKDPAKRPTSALQLAAALPGGDPVAAALAAGETPSPEMVAASGGEGALSSRAGWSLLAGIVAAIAGVLWIAPYSTDLGLAPMTRGASVFRERAQQILARFGIDRGALDSADWFERDYDRLAHHAKHEPSMRWRRALRDEGAPMRYVYRQDPDWMRMQDWQGRVNRVQPPPIVPGMAIVTLDANGALMELSRRPPEFDSTTASAGVAPDWVGLFSEARLDYTRFHSIESHWISPIPFDAHGEWVGPASTDSSVVLRVAAAAYAGRPTWFRVIGPWSKPLATLGPGYTASTAIVTNVVFGLFVCLLFGCGWLAFRNVWLGRGDRRGAARIGLFVLACSMLGWCARTHYYPDFTPMIWNATGQGLAPGLVYGLFAASIYLALEPYLRRRMPELLIGWARLLEGRFRDPRVGRDVLIGAMGGVFCAFASHIMAAVPSWRSISGETTVPIDADALYGGIRSVSAGLGALNGALFFSLMLFGILFLLRLVLRSQLAALIGVMLVATALSLGGESFAFELPFAIVMGVVTMACVARGGLLATVALFVFKLGVLSVPLPLGHGAPYTAASTIALIALLALAVYAFRISLGARFGLGRGIAEELS